jgi:hypothetical protein
MCLTERTEDFNSKTFGQTLGVRIVFEFIELKKIGSAAIVHIYIEFWFEILNKIKFSSLFIFDEFGSTK